MKDFPFVGIGGIVAAFPAADQFLFFVGQFASKSGQILLKVAIIIEIEFLAGRNLIRSATGKWRRRRGDESALWLLWLGVFLGFWLGLFGRSLFCFASVSRTSFLRNLFDEFGKNTEAILFFVRQVQLHHRPHILVLCKSHGFKLIAEFEEFLGFLLS